jgi:hypothetical protein
MHRLCILLILAATSGMADPNAIFVPLPNSGITVTATGPESAILENTTDRTVIAFGIQWQFFGPHQEAQGVESNVYMHWHERDNPEIPAHSTRSISLLDFKSTEASWSLATSVRVVLDVVIFDDGTYVGPDRTNATQILTEKWKAIQTVLSSLVAKQGNGSEAEIEAWAKNTLAQAQSHKLELNSSVPTDVYDNFAGAFLREFIRMCEHQHFQDAMDLAASVLATPIPMLKRQEP